jgi:hypothetical protein
VFFAHGRYFSFLEGQKQGKNQRTEDGALMTAKATASSHLGRKLKGKFTTKAAKKGEGENGFVFFEPFLRVFL